MEQARHVAHAFNEYVELIIVAIILIIVGVHHLL